MIVFFFLPLSGKNVTECYNPMITVNNNNNFLTYLAVDYLSLLSAKKLQSPKDVLHVLISSSHVA